MIDSAETSHMHRLEAKLQHQRMCVGTGHVAVNLWLGWVAVAYDVRSGKQHAPANSAYMQEAVSGVRWHLKPCAAER